MKNTMRKTCVISALFLTACATQKQVVISDIEWQKATADVQKKYAHQVEGSLSPYFLEAKLHYPPQKIALLTFKKEKMMELWASEDAHSWQHIRNYPLTAFSGSLGPKLKRNDGQIPEGVYKITHFNPFSSQHLSLMLNYPNQFDKTHAQRDGRSNLGDNIFIHGKEKSVGCLAVGDNAINELFVLVQQVGKDNTKIIIAPNDLRRHKASALPSTSPAWLPNLYANISKQLQPFSL